MMFTGEQIEPFMLATGAGLHPLQWLTTNFLHGDIFHLIFNMLVLWVFGLVVEGKLGTLKMLAVYLGIGILYGAIVQILTLGNEPGHCLGASAIIFGLAVMCLIWAPENRIEAFLIVWIIIFFRAKSLSTKISVVVGIALTLQVITLYFLGGGLSSELLHIVGAVVGLIVGLAMLKMNHVDCENWDIFSVWSGKNLLTDEDRAKIEKNKPKDIKRRAEERQKRQKLLAEEIELALKNQTPLPAFIIAQRKEREFSDWTLPQELHLKMIQQLLRGKHLTEAIVSLRQYLERHQEQSVHVRLMLAQALLTQNKPSAAMKVLDDISPEGLGTEQRTAIPKIRAKADAMHQKNLEEGIYELDG
jgi:membrane associated rhomboid family serine protease